MQLEILDRTALPEQECVVLERLGLGRVTGDHAVLNGPHICVAFPASEVFAVEEFFRIARFPGGRYGMRLQEMQSG